MNDPILSERNLNGKPVCFLTGRFFSRNAVDFEITGSEITGPGIYDVTHTVKNIAKHTYAYIEMLKLIAILQTETISQ